MNRIVQSKVIFITYLKNILCSHIYDKICLILGLGITLRSRISLYTIGNRRYSS